MVDQNFCEKVEKQFCAKVSTQAEDQFIGTAPHVDLWFLLEYTGKWSASALQDSTLSPVVKDWFASQKQDYPTSRTQLIRQSQRPHAHITFFVALTHEDHQALYKFELEHYEDLLGIDIPGLVAGDPVFEQYLYHEPIYLVCTNGKHDLCCSKFGMPVYKELEVQAGSNGWQTTHLGGDRFAANVVTLPTGVYYGRVAVPEVRLIMEATDQQHIYRRKYRGRTCYGIQAQAAEYFIRLLTDDDSLSSLRFLSLQEEATGLFKVAFQLAHSCQIYQLLLSQTVTETVRYSSCSGNKPVKQCVFKVEASHILEPILPGIR